MTSLPTTPDALLSTKSTIRMVDNAVGGLANSIIVACSIKMQKIGG